MPRFCYVFKMLLSLTTIIIRLPSCRCSKRKGVAWEKGNWAYTVYQIKHSQKREIVHLFLPMCFHKEASLNSSENGRGTPEYYLSLNWVRKALKEADLSVCYFIRITHFYLRRIYFCDCDPLLSRSVMCKPSPMPRAFSYPNCVAYCRIF